jgi:hypothetical protein
MSKNFEKEIREELPEKAQTIIDIVNGKYTDDIDYENYWEKLAAFPKVVSWLSRCPYFPNHKNDIQMELLNECLDGYGVESIEGNYVDRYNQNIQATFVAMGDPYAITILYDNVKRKFIITSLDDWVERYEESRGIR